jgi:hypothetical protein
MGRGSWLAEACTEELIMVLKYGLESSYSRLKLDQIIEKKGKKNLVWFGWSDKIRLKIQL